MNRIDLKFKELKRARKKALILFITAGDPSLKKTEELIYAFEKEGVDLIELGVPFSDPLADGPVIQASSMRALTHHTNLAQILALVKRVRRKSRVPLLFMSYLNPIQSYGIDRFARDAKAAGLDGVIIPDLPPDEGKAIAKSVNGKNVHLVYLLAPTSTPARQERVVKASRGFVYYVSITGVTGVQRDLPPLVKANILSAKRRTKLPVCVGFGVSNPEQARSVAKAADGVIIGSAVVRALNEHRGLSAAAFAKKFVRPFARALGK